MRILPLIYMNLTDEDIERHECSDRLWLFTTDFEHYMTDPGVVSLLQLTNRLEQTVVGSVYGTHDEPNVIYVPSWIHDMLELDAEVEVSRAELSLCTGLTIKPHAPQYEPDEEILRDAFEHYTCLMPGTTIPLWVGGAVLYVTIAALKPVDAPLCIRNCELELEVLSEEPNELNADVSEGKEEREKQDPAPSPSPSPSPDTEGKGEEKEEEEEKEKEKEKEKEPEGIVLGGAAHTNMTKRQLAAEAALRRREKI